MLVILSGVSGAGKDTIKKELIKRMENVISLPSFTSRGPRPGEEEGVQYHFITKDEFKERIKKGESLDSILPEAFAVCREASSRVLGMKHFRVQLLGGMVLHQGRIAEMKTGEGKTLVATLPAYLNGLTGKGVHVITVNDYLAKTQMEEMKPYNV